jgi:hypothetical protein
MQLGRHQSKDFSGRRPGVQDKSLDRALDGNCVIPRVMNPREKKLLGLSDANIERSYRRKARRLSYRIDPGKIERIK